MARILLVDDDSDLVALVAKQVRDAGHSVEEFDCPEKAEGRLFSGEFDLLLTDLEMPGLSGMDLLKAAKAHNPAIVVILLTGHGTIETAVEAMKLGAFDYLRKPFPAQELLVVIDKALHQKELEEENRRLRQELHEKYHFANLAGTSAGMQAVFRLIERAGPSSSTVLVLGESGTGKELVARALHEISPRSGRRFLKVNCSALAENLLESELFGHERGAFTGAITTKRGLFEAAHGGTLFLDEVGDTPLPLQAKLLRVLQEGEFRRVGGLEDIQVDVRILAATNRDLKQLIAEGRFRQDLYYRLNVVSIPLPPLRERAEDIPLLVGHFLRKKAGDRPLLPFLSEEVLQVLQEYPWPGNVRELENALERAVVLSETSELQLLDFPEEIRSAASQAGQGTQRVAPPSRHWMSSLEELEKTHIQQVLEKVEGHREKASQILGITRRTLYEKIKRFHLEDSTR
jgi:DNA-binding NtrC family response regulator